MSGDCLMETSATLKIGDAFIGTLCLFLFGKQDRPPVSRFHF
jgi:hypothetical protein